MIIICGNSIAEVEQDLAMVKMAMASGASVGLGGQSIEDVERAMQMLKNADVPTYTPTPYMDESEDESESAEALIAKLENIGVPDHILEYIRETC
jgi:hypothetical protein